MRHGSADRDIKHLTGKHGCRSDSATDICGSRTINCSIHVVGTARTKIRDSPSLCCTHNTSCLCRNQGLMIHLRKQSGLDELCIN